MLRCVKETEKKQPNIPMEMHYLCYDLGLAAIVSCSLFMNTAVIYTDLAQGASSTMMVTTMKTIIMVRVMKYYSQVCSDCLRTYQNESQGGKGPPSFCNFVVRY